MKELSIKEKAEAYDRALEKARQLCVYPTTKPFISDLQDLFPELKKPEDEEIRKGLIENFKWFCGDYPETAKWGKDDNLLVKDIIAWLEKQGKVPVTINIDKMVEDYANNEDCDNEGFGKPVNCMIRAYRQGLTDAIATVMLEKQGEQKPAFEMKSAEESLGIDSETYNKIVDECIYGDDEQKPVNKVEPKFKAGNWYQCTKDFFGKGVTFDKNTAYYCAQEGCLQNEYGCHIAIVKDLYDNFKLWAIQDAKDGDVLVASDDSIFLFAGVVDCACKYYVALTTCNDIKINKEVEGGYWETSRAVHPATPKQRNTLFAKIKEAGYEWDAEHKQLKKIEQKSAWSEEDEEYLQRAIKATKEVYPITSDWLKSLKQRIKL